MSGVFGVCSGSEQIKQGDLLSCMAAAMTHRAWYQVDTYTAPHVALGRIGIGIFNPDRQPARDEGIAPLMTLEMVLRLLIDGEPAPVAADAQSAP